MAYIPHIKLLHTINSGYFYDVNRNEVLPLGEDEYTYLEDVLNRKKTFGEDMPEILDIYKQNGYLSDSKPEKIEHQYSHDLPFILDRKVNKITLQITQECNFRCKYCVYSNNDGAKQRKHSKASMTFETAKKAVDFLAEHAVDSKEVNIGFYGGEPLLMFDLVKQIMEYAKERFMGKKLTFSITSNASLLTKEIVGYFAENEVPLLISFDGPKEIQDKNRVLADGKTGTFDLVRKNLEMVKREYPDYFKNFSINMVIDPKNSFELVRSLEEDELFSQINMQISMLDEEYTPFLQDENHKPKEQKSSEAFEREYQYMVFLSYLALLKKLDKESLPKVMSSAYGSYQRMDRDMLPRTRLEKIAAPNGPCLPGQKRLFVDVNGNFYPCERVSETADCMCIGNLQEGYWMDKAQKILNIGVLTAENCKNCWAFSMCGLCAKAAETDGKLSGEYKAAHCQGVRNSAESTLYDFLLQREANTMYD